MVDKAVDTWHAITAHWLPTAEEHGSPLVLVSALELVLGGGDGGGGAAAHACGTGRTCLASV
ncbi:hypothetical protein ColTof4_07500 [Colletotrichum tofieldiae]|nr:hypothetical protein ColTof3_12451 [Colletotrichum tofieldiae]GKT75077.1 hypothetical protein ColTof4_07500 [Colletotrichum tofieldiae]GKT92307.1 hypothetical protein Ct61P_10157 [Colletotrichum tofieldiae]